MGRPNVVIFYTDDQGTMDAGCYGSVDLKTPHMDGLAGRGIRFTQAYAHTVCCPSRSALLTGRFPQRSGINDWASNHVSDEKGINMFLDEVTIAQILKAEGYRTALFGKWHVGAKLEHGPNAFGFDEFFGHRCGFIDNYKHMFLHSNRGQPPFHDLWRDLEEVFEDGVYFSDLVVREAHRFLDEAGDDQACRKRVCRLRYLQRHLFLQPRFRTGCSGASSRGTTCRDHTIPGSLIRFLLATTPRLRT